MNFCISASVVALTMSGCLNPKGELAIQPRYINEAVMKVEGWDQGCDNLGKCIVIGALPPRKAKSVYPDIQLLRGEVQLYEDWLVGCDNNAQCTMIGFPETLALRSSGVPEHDMAIQISLMRPADLDPVVELVPFSVNIGRKAANDTAEPNDIAEPFVLNVEYDVAAISPKHGFSLRELLPMEAVAVIRHLDHDKRLEGKALSNGKVIVRFPEAGFKRAYAAMRNRQAHLLKDLADKAIEDVPDGRSMPISGMQRRIPAMPMILPGLAPIHAAENCGDSSMEAVRRFGFPNGAEIWSYSCDDGSYPSRTYWEMASGASVRTTPLSLPEPRDMEVRAGIDGLDNAIFDFDFGILRAYKYQKGREDCGTFRAWGFTESGWQLLERREMPLCMGLDPTQWIQTHFVPTGGTGPDE